jgi:protein-disulfide isomerase
MRHMLQRLIGVALVGGVAAVAGGPAVAAPPAAVQAAPIQIAQAQIPQAQILPTVEGEFGTIALRPNDRKMGRDDAPVTMVEYASFTCPHCADFHKNTLPQLIKFYVETGKMLYVYRDYPLDRIALQAAHLPRCVTDRRRFGFGDVLYSTQARWMRAKDVTKALRGIARLGGMSDKQFDACIADQSIQTSILEERLEAQQKYQVASTPTMFINGVKYSGALSFEVMQAIIDPILAKK